MIRNPSIQTKKTDDTSPTIIAIIVSLFLGLFWASGPVFGWSEYSIESTISCSVEWNKRTPSIISYNISMFIFVFIVPLAIIIFTNANIIFIVSYKFKIEDSLFNYILKLKAKGRRLSYVESNRQSIRRERAEDNLTIRSSVMISMNIIYL